MDKKGLKPIALTGILIFFAIVFGIIIMLINNNTVESEEFCNVDVGMKLVTISEKELLCYDQENKEIKFTIENGAETKIEGLIVKIIKNQEEEVTELNELNIGKVANYVANIPSNFHPEEIEIVPVVTIKDRNRKCVKESIEREDISIC